MTKVSLQDMFPKLLTQEDPQVAFMQLNFKVISGGQTGVDRAGLEAAKELGIRTGGVAPLGYRTNVGRDYTLKSMYDLRESPSKGYGPRTEINVVQSDATLIIAGKISSPGTDLTIRACVAYDKPYRVIDLSDPSEIPPPGVIANWIVESMRETYVLNVAGNSEETYPGISEIAKGYLTSIFSLCVND